MVSTNDMGVKQTKNYGFPNGGSILALEPLYNNT